MVDQADLRNVFLGEPPVAFLVFLGADNVKFAFPIPDQGSGHVKHIGHFPDGIIFFLYFFFLVRHNKRRLRQGLVFSRSQFENLIKFAWLQVFEEIVNRIKEFSILHHFIMHVRRGGRTGAAYITDLVASFYFLAYLDSEVVHMRIAGGKAKTMVDHHKFTISSKLGFYFFDYAVTCGINRRPFSSGKVDTGVHFSYLQNGMEPHAVTGGKPVQFFIMDWL